MIDRMERVGLPPLHEPDIAFHCLQGLLELPEDEALSPFVLDMARLRFRGSPIFVKPPPPGPILIGKGLLGYSGPAKCRNSP